MSVSPAEAVENLQRRLGQRPAEDVAAEVAAKALLPTFLRALKEAGATRVVLFGSLAVGLFRRGSDIDLAVAGVSERGLARLERVLTVMGHIPVELANLDAISPSFKSRVERAGLELA